MTLGSICCALRSTFCFNSLVCEKNVEGFRVISRAMIINVYEGCFIIPECVGKLVKRDGGEDLMLNCKHLFTI